MSRLGQQVERVERVVRSWKPGESVARHLSDHFSCHRNMGARDRRECRAWVYAWIRLGRSLEDLPFAKRLAVATYLTTAEPYPALEALLNSELSDIELPSLQSSVEEKTNAVARSFPGFSLEKIFPGSSRISSGLDRAAFLSGLFLPPELWIRVRTKYREQVIQELTDRSIPFTVDPILPNAIRLPNRTSIDDLEASRKHLLEVQDRSSQATAEFFQPKSGETWWDACAGSGGKSLLLLDQEPGLHLTVSDRRPSILKNLKERFGLAKLKPDELVVCDLTQPETDWPEQMFDVILADVPCSGSGTWTRKPEGLFTEVDEAFFQRFRSLQQKIVKNLSSRIKPGGRFIYLTCSVFSAENEEMLSWVEQETNLKLQQYRYFEGAAYRADTLFGASFLN